MKDHDEIHKLLSAYCGGDLEPERRARVEEHLAACPICRADLADLETALRLIRTTPEVEPPPWLTSRIMARLRDEAAPRRRWYQWLLFPARTRLPLEVMALLVVCVSGYYLARNLENQVNAPTVTPEMPATPQPAAEPAKPARQVPPAPVPGPAAPIPEKGGQPAIRREQPLVAQPTAPRSAEQPIPPAPAASNKAMSPPAYVPAPPAKRVERAAPDYGANIESKEAEPKADQSYRYQSAAPELNKAEKKAKRAADSVGQHLLSDKAPAATGAALEQAPPRLKLRLAISDLSSADRLVRQAVARSGGEVVQAADERHVKVRIRKDRLPGLLERLGRIARIVERPAPPDSAGMLEIEIGW